MNDVQLLINENQEGKFFIMDGDEQVGEMIFSLSPGNLTVYHTEVVQKPETKGFAGKLLDAMASYAREHKLKVVPLCPYVHLQFKRHPEKFSDLWNPIEE